MDSTIKAPELQRMSAGSGVRTASQSFAERGHALSADAGFFQPDTANIEPSYEESDSPRREAAGNCG